MVKRLNSYVDTPFALIIQYDGFILNPDAWRDEFLDYDYIGAPWWEEQEYIVGNGGVSLRSKRLLELTQQDAAILDPTALDPSDAPEDWYLCVMIRPYAGRVQRVTGDAPSDQRWASETSLRRSGQYRRASDSGGWAIITGCGIGCIRRLRLQTKTFTSLESILPANVK